MANVIDATKHHLGNGADTEQQASWHIVTFLLFCADRDLLAPSVDATSLRRAPVEYFGNRMGGTLRDNDLSEQGAAFAEAIWDDYAVELADLAMTHDIEHTYKFCEQPNAEEIRGWAFEYLDEALESFGEE